MEYEYEHRMDQIQAGWFSELNDLWPGQSFSLQIDKVLHHEKSQYQDILVFQRYGRALHAALGMAGWLQLGSSLFETFSAKPMVEFWHWTV